MTCLARSANQESRRGGTFAPRVTFSSQPRAGAWDCNRQEGRRGRRVTASFALTHICANSSQTSMGDMDNPNRGRNLGFFFDQATDRVPDKVAIIDLFGGRERCTTYRQLDERMDRVARMLARL